MQSDTVIYLEDLEKIELHLNGKPLNTDKYFFSKIEEEENIYSYGEHSLLSGILDAYRLHKSITLSPDIIWLLILQGFSYHVTKNAESLRTKFVSFNNKKELVVDRRDLFPDTANEEDWMDILGKFVSQISEFTGKELTNTLDLSFSQTTNIAHTAGQIAIMSSMQHYFDYKVLMGGCGFPSITIEGTIEDWEKIMSKINEISKYNLEWWTNKLTPIIKEFINAKKGEINKSFWLTMMRYKDGTGYYDPSYIDGWICSFFPYDRFGCEKNLQRIYKIEDCASEIITTPFKLFIQITRQTMNCEFRAGFMGCKETRTSEGVYNVKPIIGWGVGTEVVKPRRR